jgi:hypothetical protein
MRKQRCSIKHLIIAALLAFSPVTAQAQTLVVNDHITFGHIAMRNNSAPRDIQLLSDGDYLADPAYVFYADVPQLARLTLTGQVPNHLMDVSIDVAGVEVGPSGGGAAATFTLVNPFTVPASVVTDGAGNATFFVGATLRSDGSGNTYVDANYLGVITINVVPN